MDFSVTTGNPLYADLPDFKKFLDRICILRKRTERTIVAVAGPPAAGKSSLCKHLADMLNARFTSLESCVVPMDGYHLSNDALITRGRLHRKGAPDTFDFAGLLGDIKVFGDRSHTCVIPVFDRANDRVVPEGFEIAPNCNVVFVEGNYLMLEAEPWVQLRHHFDLTVFLRVTIGTVETRIRNRWLEFGLSEDDAVKRGIHNDIPNAELVLEKSGRADFEFTDYPPV